MSILDAVKADVALGHLHLRWSPSGLHSVTTAASLRATASRLDTVSLSGCALEAQEMVVRRGSDRGSDLNVAAENT